MNPSIIRVLRDFVPIRPLSRAEALRIAELQAARFLELSGVSEGPVRDELISELPRLQVERLPFFPVSGATQWANGRWLVILNGSEPETRQRFSMAHEFKHILDHRYIDQLYSGVPEPDRAAWTEQVCDYFAACLLMPRAWVKRSYCSGMQGVPQLAAAFNVSQTAMRYRLTQIGLVGPTERCGLSDDTWQQIRAAARSIPIAA